MSITLKYGRSLFVLLLLVSLTNCSKEKVEPVRTTEDVIATGWRLTQYLRNGVDETSQLVIKNYEESYAKPEAHSRSYIDENNQAQSQTGTWKYDKEKNRINVSGVSSVKMTRTTGSVSSSYYEIQKLDDQTLWYVFVNSNDRHEFRFVKK